MSSSAEYIFNESEKFFKNKVKTANKISKKISYCFGTEIPTINIIDNIPVKFIAKITKEPRIICQNDQIKNTNINSNTNSQNKKQLNIKEKIEKFNYKGSIHIITENIFPLCSCHSSNLILYENEKKLKKYSSKQINDYLLEVKKILPKLKFSKLFGEFQILNNYKSTNKNLGYDIFGLEYSNCQDCVVCYEKTYTKTSCKHHLCLECWAQVKNNECPMCRNELRLHENSHSSSYTNNEELESDDESASESENESDDESNNEQSESTWEEYNSEDDGQEDTDNEENYER